MSNVLLKSTITCPECREEATETMPTNSCQYFWECPSCGNLLKPQKGDCCVFCSFGDIPCPPVQQDEQHCC
ncbi:GDCCVxC domain-containing (seleno)protein [Fodinibius roseus]|uniref:GDCCVxC domain-containing (seleno)protein n=1 Tax=Fodinibius roseus TaxID=1194090 RepID=UPI000934FFF3|nr:GDCCVxC domain-containing (seleno)protein [Fodinibius roseus]